VVITFSQFIDPDSYPFVRYSGLGHIVTDLYETAKNSEQLKTTQNIALTVQQALQDTDFEDTKQQINQILRDIAERLGTRIV